MKKLMMAVALLAAVLPRMAMADSYLKIVNTSSSVGVGGEYSYAIVNGKDYADVMKGEFSISFWIKDPVAHGDRTSQDHNKVGYVVGNGGYSANKGFAVGWVEGEGNAYRQFCLQVKDTGFTSIYPFVDGGTATGDCGVTDGKWHHVVITYSATKQVCCGYLDGVLKGTTSGSQCTHWAVATDDGVSSLRIGSQANGLGWCLSASLAHLSLWNRALTADDVGQLASQPAAPDAKGLVGLWRFDEGVGTTAADGKAAKPSAATLVKDCRWGLGFKVSLLGYSGVADGNSHACSILSDLPDGTTVKWAWNGDLENFEHDNPQSFTAVGVYTNKCKVVSDGYLSYADRYMATVVMRADVSVYVSPTGDDGAAGTYDAPFRTIQHAVDVLGETGGRVLLFDGTYTGYKRWKFWDVNAFTNNICVVVSTAVEIAGLSGDPRKVIIDAEDKAMGVLLRHDAAQLRFVTIKDGNTMADDGIPASGGNLRQLRGMTSDCIFTNGLANGHGGNAFINHGCVVRCESIGGRARQGSCQGIFAINEDSIVENCFIHGVRAEDARVKDPLSPANGKTLSAACSRHDAQFVNCTIANNENEKSESLGAAFSFDNSTVSDPGWFINCAIFNNGGTAEAEWSNKRPEHFINCATAVGIAGGRSCVTTTDPLFWDAAGDDYRIRKGSPLIGKGDIWRYRYAANAVSEETDFAGKSRFYKTALSIGCYECVPPGFAILLR